MAEILAIRPASAAEGPLRVDHHGPVLRLTLVCPSHSGLSVETTNHAASSTVTTWENTSQ